MVSHGLYPLGLRFNVLYFKSYQETGTSNIDFLIADVASVKCRNNFITRGCNRSSKKVFGSRNICASCYSRLLIGNITQNVDNGKVSNANHV